MGDKIYIHAVGNSMILILLEALVQGNLSPCVRSTIYLLPFAYNEGCCRASGTSAFAVSDSRIWIANLKYQTVKSPLQFLVLCKSSSKLSLCFIVRNSVRYHDSDRRDINSLSSNTLALVISDGDVRHELESLEVSASVGSSDRTALKVAHDCHFIKVINKSCGTLVLSTFELWFLASEIHPRLRQLQKTFRTALIQAIISSSHCVFLFLLLLLLFLKLAS